LFLRLEFLSLFLLLAIFGCRSLDPRAALSGRGVASEAPALVMGSEELEERLETLHLYYLLGQQYLQQFDRELSETPPDQIYRQGAYLKLLAVRSLAEEIETEILEQSLEHQKARRPVELEGLQRLVAAFASRSSLRALSMENLRHLLGLSAAASLGVNPKELELELQLLGAQKSFRLREKNIQHLAHLLETSLERADGRFFPSAGGPGNITGNEFPAKVWSLTFDDGPARRTSIEILRNLQQRNLVATFFQLTSRVASFPDEARQIREAGMEIAGHSYTHQKLTNVNAQVLEREITQSVRDLERLQQLQVKFFRLPYGAGVGAPHIRQRIAAAGLIHVFWNVDTLDWMAQTPDKIVSRTRELMRKTPRDAGVILFHDIHPRTVEASKVIMDDLKLNGRRTCTLDEIVGQLNQGAATVCPAHSP
jgi:peptidoglycan/xylan/chitin deacetylase (PgdA/CDA1 family)